MTSPDLGVAPKDIPLKYNCPGDLKWYLSCSTMFVGVFTSPLLGK